MKIELHLMSKQYILIHTDYLLEAMPPSLPIEQQSHFHDYPT